MKEKKQEELQSRREFFKSAAKAALPVLGAVVLSNLPVVQTQAMKTGCGYTCQGSCTSACAGSCTSSCRGGCTSTCKGSCTVGCVSQSR